MLGLISALYLSRAVEEFILFKPSLLMFATCTISGLIYVALLALSVRKPPRVDVETATQEDEMMHVWRAGNLRHTAYLCTDLESQGQSAVRSQRRAGNVTGFI